MAGAAAGLAADRARTDSASPRDERRPADARHVVEGADGGAGRAASGTEFARLWLEGMIHHHQGAVDMALAQQQREFETQRQPYGIAAMTDEILRGPASRDRHDEDAAPPVGPRRVRAPPSVASPYPAGSEARRGRTLPPRRAIARRNAPASGYSASSIRNSAPSVSSVSIAEQLVGPLMHVADSNT